MKYLSIGREKSAYWLLLLWIATIYAAIQWLYPNILDDIGFSNLYREFSTSETFSLSAISDFYLWVRAHDNGRLANLLAPFATLFFPFRQLFPLMTGALMAVSIGLTQKMAEFRFRCHIPLFTLSMAWLLFLFFLPWRDFIFSADFALNYIWGAAITLSFIYLLVRLELRGWTIPAVIWMSMLAVIAGGWHEGFMVPSFIGLAVWSAFRRGKMSIGFYTVMVVFAVSAIVILCSAGTSARLNTYLFSSWPSITNLMFIWQIFPFIIMLVSTVLATAFRRNRSVIWREFFRNPFCWIGLGVIASGYGMAIILNSTPRAYLWPGVFSIILSLILLLPIFESIFSRRLRAVLAIIFITICSIQNLTVIYWVGLYRKEYDAIEEQFTLRKGGTVFYDVMQPWDLPAYTLFIPPRTVWTNPINYLYLYQTDDYQFVGVVPKILENASLSKGMPLGGNLGARIIDGYIVAPYQFSEGAPQGIVRPYFVELELTDIDGHKEVKSVMETAFITISFSTPDGSVKSDTLMYYSLHPDEIQKISEISLFNPRRW